MLRFAVSPTKDMDINSLRIAIFNYIVSKQSNEQLIVRIDDTDKENNIEGKEKDILEILSLFSIEHTSVIYQSENLKYHQKLVMQLMGKKNAFSCFCSDEKLNELKEKAKSKGKVYSYDDFCSTLSDETVLSCNAPFTVRVKRPEKDISFTDKLAGTLIYKPYEVDSFIILNHDKMPTYNYACAVDDMISNISTVIRDISHTADTAKQIHLRSLLNYDVEIAYTHIPSISNTNNLSIKSLIDEGFLPSAIANYLVLLGNQTPSEIFTLEEAIKWFDINTISKESVQFDIEKLKIINKKHLESMDNLRLSKILGFADSDLGKLAKLYLEENNTIKELKSKIELIFAPKSICEGFEEEFVEIKLSMQNAPYFNELDELKNYLTKETSIEGEKLTKALSCLLTACINGPKLDDVYPLIKNYIGEIIK